MAEAAERDYSLFGDEHIAQYEATDGEVGYLWNGAPCLVLAAGVVVSRRSRRAGGAKR